MHDKKIDYKFMHTCTQLMARLIKEGYKLAKPVQIRNNVLRLPSLI